MDVFKSKVTQYLGFSGKRLSKDIKEFKVDHEAMRNKLLYDYLDKDDYKDYTILHQKIEDHIELKKLRKQYFHISHECSFTGGVINVMDPHGKSIRDKPSRRVEWK